VCDTILSKFDPHKEWPERQEVQENKRRKTIYPRKNRRELIRKKFRELAMVAKKENKPPILDRVEKIHKKLEKEGKL